MQKLAIVLTAHGTKDPKDSAVVFEYSQELEQLLNLPIYTGFGEFIQPSTLTALLQAAQKGANKIVLLPYFLFSSPHTMQDLENYIQQFHQSYPDTLVIKANPIGKHALIPQILKDRFQEAFLKNS